MELTSRMKMTRFQTFWIQMRKTKPLDESGLFKVKSGLYGEIKVTYVHMDIIINLDVKFGIPHGYSGCKICFRLRRQF
ncbi:hypothetical protein Hanom_Chr12g01158231 [Helianthus anomalus]